MAAAETDQYTIEWEEKPLGFSIVMDTTGRNAYVSSIQKPENMSKGLKLAAQIIKINNQNVKQKKHGEILDIIRHAKLPMKLTFQPRSFANANPSGDDNSGQVEVPETLLFGGAPESSSNRVDGLFLLQQDKEINGRKYWKRKDDESDSILLYYLPTEGGDQGTSNVPENVWMIARESQLHTENAYACCPSDVLNPLHIKTFWKVWNKTSQSFVECKLSIADQVKLETVRDF